MKKILLLGAGLVSKHLVEYLLNIPNIFLTVSSQNFYDRAKIDSHEKGNTVNLNIEDKPFLIELIKKHNLIISLLPQKYHLKVAEICIEFHKPMTNASYVSEGMAKLDKKAKEAGVMILNEAGLDPGIDHMSAMDIITRIKKNGGNITSFHSVCGGLPFWDAVTTPFHYKFSWSPVGVLQASKNDALYKKDGKIIHVPNKNLLDAVYRFDLGQFGEYEVYPNRDSVKYRDIYGLNGIQTIFRGTIRNIGWSETFSAINKLDLLNQKDTFDLTKTTYANFLRQKYSLKKNVDICSAISQKLNLHTLSQIINRLSWLGLFDEEQIIGIKGTSFDVILNLCKEKLTYEKHEKDMILLHHTFIYNDKDGIKKEHTSFLIAHGDDTEGQIMSKTVGLPLAIASRFILENVIPTTPGVHIPTAENIYLPILDELKKFKITFIEETKTLAVSSKNKQ